MSTLGNFVAELEKESLYGKIWINFARKYTVGEKNWAKAMAVPLNDEAVLGFAAVMQKGIIEELESWSEMGPYLRTQRNGHAFLRLIHQKAEAAGIVVSLNQIDVLLSYTELAEAAGIVQVDENGFVRLTPKGEALADKLQ